MNVLRSVIDRLPPRWRRPIMIRFSALRLPLEYLGDWKRFHVWSSKIDGVYPGQSHAVAVAQVKRDLHRIEKALTYPNTRRSFG